MLNSHGRTAFLCLSAGGFAVGLDASMVARVGLWRRLLQWSTRLTLGDWEELDSAWAPRSADTWRNGCTRSAIAFGVR